MIRFCLFGAGKIGAIHAENIAKSKRAKMAFVVDPDINAAQRLANVFGGQSSDCAEEALSADCVDAVLIASSTDTHAGLLIQAAEKGKAVFCEKPLDLNMEQVERCLDVLQRCRVHCLVGFNRRFDPAFNAVHQQIQEGAIGEVEMVCITSRDPHPPQLEYISRSGGLFRDMSIHDFDMARWLLGGEAVKVSADASCLVDSRIGEAGDVDTAMITLKTERGALCHINNSRRAVNGYDQRIEVLGSKGVLTSDESVAVTPLKPDAAVPFFIQRYRESYRIELEHFLDVLEGKATCQVTAEDGRRALQLAYAAQESVRIGRAVVLEMDPQLVFSQVLIN